MSGLVDQRTLLDPEDIDRALTRMVSEILEANRGADGLCFLGIQRGGVPLAQRLVERVAGAEKTTPPLGTLDITLYRDDIGAHQVPQVGPTRIGFPVTGRAVVLVDDVLYTGRTVRAALDELVDFGRPRRVYLAVLVERPGRELPIQPDFIGKHVAARAEENIEVRLREQGGEDVVVLQERR